MNSLKEFFKKDLSKIFITVMVIFLLCTVSAYTVMAGNLPMAKKISGAFVESAKDIVTLQGKDLSIAIIINNTVAGGISVLMGILPFVLFPMFSLLVNSFVIGGVLSLGAATSQIPLWKTVLFGVMPHGIIELPALFLSLSLGIYLCLFISKKILKKTEEKFSYAIVNILKMYLFVIVPMFIVAGLIEGFVTPIIMNKFM